MTDSFGIRDQEAVASFIMVGEYSLLMAGHARRNKHEVLFTKMRQSAKKLGEFTSHNLMDDMLTIWRQTPTVNSLCAHLKKFITWGEVEIIHYNSSRKRMTYRYIGDDMNEQETYEKERTGSQGHQDS